MGWFSKVKFGTMVAEKDVETDVMCNIMPEQCVPLLLMKQITRLKLDMLALRKSFGIFFG